MEVRLLVDVKLLYPRERVGVSEVAVTIDDAEPDITESTHGSVITIGLY